MQKRINLDTWERREHFLFFRGFDEPFYGVTVQVDCTRAYRDAKAAGVSFFLYYLYKALKAVQQVENFRMRIAGEEVVIYDVINAGFTVARNNGTFGYGYFDYADDFRQFITIAGNEISRVQATTDLQRSPREDLVRFSALPWIDFTAVSHARMFSVKESCPRISFGKMTQADGVCSMPVSIHVHHALVDGIHIGQYIDCFQQLMNESV
ncbi:MAG: chloramphenicol acetyltransferase [Chitinophagaceae bacterium]